MKRVLSGMLLGLGLLQVSPANAFNVKNDTPWIICVWGNKGHYADTISPGGTNRGWNLNSSIELTIVPLDESVCVGEYGQNCSTKCNEVEYSTITVPAHAQLHVTGTTYEPGNVGDDRRKTQWVMWALGAPAKFKMNLQ